MQHFNEAMEQVRLSPIVAISEEARLRAADYERSGKPFVRFQRGEIDFATPAHIQAAVAEGLRQGLTKYPKSGGEDFYREAAVSYLHHRFGVSDLTPAQVVATAGGQEGLELCFRLFGRGAGLAPIWSCALENFVPFAQVQFTELPLDATFRVDLQRLDEVTRQVQFLYLNNPHNPTGKVFRRDELDAIVAICTRNGCFIVSDEAYERITFDGLTHHSLVTVPQDNIITVFTLSKAFAMTGWRLGFVVTRNAHVAKLLRLGNYTQTAGVPTFLQYAGSVALSDHSAGDRAVATMVSEFQRRRDALFQGLQGLPGVQLPEKPGGAFYIFPNFSGAIPATLSGEPRHKHIYELLMQHGMATVNGSCFGHHFGDSVRFSFSCTPVPLIEEATARLRQLFGAG